MPQQLHRTEKTFQEGPALMPLLVKTHPARLRHHLRHSTAKTQLLSSAVWYLRYTAQPLWRLPGPATTEITAPLPWSLGTNRSSHDTEEPSPRRAVPRWRRSTTSRQRGRPRHDAGPRRAAAGALTLSPRASRSFLRFFLAASFS